MSQVFVLTVMSDDKPGIVEKIAEAINNNDGNWRESKLAHLAGKFAGIVEFSVVESQAQELQQRLTALASEGMSVVVEPTNSETVISAKPTHQFSIVGNDRPGIIREITQAFANQGINVIELNSKCSSAPHVGTPLFEAWGKMNIPTTTDVTEFESALDKLCEQLAVDLQFDKLI